MNERGKKNIYMYLLLFSFLVVSDSLQPHRLWHARPLCSSPSPKVCPSSCQLLQWCHPTLSSSDALFSFCPQSFPTSGTFPMIQLFTSDDQNIGVSASVLHQLLELAQTPVHPVSDAFQPSHPLSSPSLPAFGLSQHQGLF